MEKYKHPGDEERLRRLFAEFVTSGKSVMLGVDGQMPDPFSDYDIQEIGVCASDLITDGFLIVSGEREGAVYVISASHGYNPVLVMPTKAMRRLKQENEGNLTSNGASTSNEKLKSVSKFLALGVWTIVIGLITGLLVALFSKKFGF